MSSLFKRKNGNYTIVFWANGKQKWISTGTRDQEKAIAYYESIRSSLDRPRTLMLEDLKHRILQYAELNHKKGTFNLFKISFTRLIACVGNKPVRFITALDVETYKEYLVKEVSRVTANDYLRSLKTAFNIGLRLNLVDSNPFKDCKMFRIPCVRPTYLRKEEFAILLRAIADQRFGLLVLFAALTGMRRGEIVNVRWVDIDMDSRLIYIQNSENFTVKAMRSRTIPMNRDMFNLLQNIPKESEYVFVDAELMPYKAGTVTKKFKRLVRDCGLSEKIHLHSLRHSYASWLVQSEIPLAEIQKLLGHSSVVTTQIYAHLDHEHLRNTVEKLQLAEFIQNAPTEKLLPLV
ncbi:MAG: tyrosine-type recombinase/integrase [Ignavibacteria bacterium]|nr:tyrosine-type recombinase/integrase [Ignavibacteria bacterium]